MKLSSLGVEEWVTDWEAVIGFVVGTLTLIGMGYGFTVFIMRRFKSILEDTVEPIVDKIVAPIRDEQAAVREELRLHMGVETALISQQNVTMESQRITMERHIRDDEAFQKRVEGRIADQVQEADAATQGRAEVLSVLASLHESITHEAKSTPRPPESDSPGLGD